MRLIGLTGGLATGKSHVGRHLVKLGCRLIQADELGHEALLPGGGAYRPVVEMFGPGILDGEGHIVRKQLAAMVFENPEKLAALNGIVHPVVRDMEKQIEDRIAAEDPEAIVVVEAAIHIETGGHTRFQKLILVVCTEEQQIARAMKRDHSTREEVLSRLRRQMPLEAKRKYADYVIDTSGPEAATFEQSVAVYNSIKNL